MGRGYDDLLKSFALELREEGVEDRMRQWKFEESLARDRHVMHKKTALVGVVTGVLALAFLCVGYNGAGTAAVHYYTPVQVVEVYATAIRLGIAQVLGLPLSLQSAQILDSMPQYNDILLRGAVVLTTLLCGALIAVSGMLFQNTFKNPIAAPSILGVSNGVQIGLLVLVMQFGVSASVAVVQRYVYCYVGGALVLALVMLAGKLLSGNRELNIFNLLIVGTIISQLLGAVMTYASQSMMSDGTYEVYYQLLEVTNAYSGNVSLLILLVACAASLVPVYLVRFRLNGLNLGEQEARAMGVSQTAMRVVALVCGSFMFLTAQLYVGSVAVFALVIPFLARRFFGVEFRKQLLGCVLFGMLLMLVCRGLAAVIPFVGTGIPVGTIASALALPLFIWMMTLQGAADD